MQPTEQGQCWVIKKNLIQAKEDFAYLSLISTFVSTNAKERADCVCPIQVLCSICATPACHAWHKLGNHTDIGPNCWAVVKTLGY